MNVMLENLMLLVIYGIEAVKFMIGTKLVLRENNQKKWMYLVGGFIALVYTVVIGTKANCLIIYLLVICITYLSINGKHFERLTKVLLLALLILSLDETIAGVTREFIYSKIGYELKFVPIFFDSLWGLFVISFLFLVNKNKKKLENDNFSKTNVFLVVILNALMTLLVVAGFNYSKEFVDSKGFQIVATILVSMAYFCMSLLCWLLVYLRGVNEQIRNALVIEKELNAYRSNYYKKLMEKEEETRRFRHDINNHIMYLISLACLNDLDNIKNYLWGLNQQVLKIQKSVFATGNTLFDVILNEKLSELQGTVKIIVIGKALCEIRANEVDLCTIFSNIIDNAKEAVREVKKDAYIVIKFQTGRDFLKITVKNSLRQKINYSDEGLPMTTKGNFVNHGIGLSNVEC